MKIELQDKLIQFVKDMQKSTRHVALLGSGSTLNQHLIYEEATSLLRMIESVESKVKRGLVDRMVDRFLCWKLPSDFIPDCGISFDGRKDDEWNKNKTWPVGTNLLTAEQARQMFEHCLGLVE